MKVGFAFKVREGRQEVARKALDFLQEQCGFRGHEQDQSSFVFTRGTRLRRAFTLRIESWPTELTIILYGEGEAATGVVMRYHIATGLHLVGALEKAIIEAEAAVLQDYLTTGRMRTVESVVGSSRRPVTVAVMLNAVLATVVVATIGLLAGYHPVAVGLVAVAVGLLDGLTITAFADIMVDGARALPRVKGSGPPPSASASVSSPDS